MYLSRIRIVLSRLTPQMLAKWDGCQPYVSHQWLWQLFASSETRSFLFRRENNACFYVLSQEPPLAHHELFIVETKPWHPQLDTGMKLMFQLRANPVITRQKKRCDVLMDAKYQAKLKGLDPAAIGQLQQQAALDWLLRQGEQHGFSVQIPAQDEPWGIFQASEQHRFVRRSGEKPIIFGSVDYAGCLEVTDSQRFTQAICRGIGKSKALGCGLMLIKRLR